MIPAPKGWKAAFVTFFAMLGIFLPAANVWTRRAYGGQATELAKITAVALVVASAAAAALLVRRAVR